MAAEDVRLRLTTKFTGKDETNRKIRALRVGLEKGSVKVVRESGEKGKRAAKRLAPRRTGALRRSIDVQHSRDGRTYVLGSPLSYAFWTEFGKHRQPWLYRTAKNQRKRIKRELKKLARRLSKRLAAPTA